MKLQYRKLSVAVALLGQGEFICHENAIKDTPLSYSCRCSSGEGVLWRISRSDFLRKVTSVENAQKVKTILESRNAGHTHRLSCFAALKLEAKSPKAASHKSTKSPHPPPRPSSSRCSSTRQLRLKTMIETQLVVGRHDNELNKEHNYMEIPIEFPTVKPKIRRTMSNLKSRPSTALALKRALNRTASMTHRQLKSQVTNIHMHAIRQRFEQELRSRAYSPFIFKDGGVFAGP